MLMLNELLFVFMEGVSGCLMNLFVVHLHNKLFFVLIGWLAAINERWLPFFVYVYVEMSKSYRY